MTFSQVNVEQMPQSPPHIAFKTGLFGAMVIIFLGCCHIYSANAEKPAGFLNQGTQHGSGLVQDTHTTNTGVVHDTHQVERSITDVISQTRSNNDIGSQLLLDSIVKHAPKETIAAGSDLETRRVILDSGNLVGRDRYILEEKISVIYPGTKQHLIKRDHQVATKRRPNLSTQQTMKPRPSH